MARLAWLLLAAALLFASHGERLSDEREQASALWNLRHGSLLIETMPDFIYKSGLEQGSREWDPTRAPGQTTPVASLLLNLLALPLAAALPLVDRVVPLGLALGGAAAFTLAKGTGAWHWMSGGWPKVAVALLALSAATSGFRGPSPDQDLYFAYTALQLTSLACWGLLAWLLWRTLHPHLPWPARTVVLAASLLGPLLFWGQGMKYHALTALLVGLLLLLRSRARSPTGLALQGLAAALLLWVNPGPGVVAVVTLAVVEAPRVARAATRRPLAKQWAALLLGFAVGLVPFMVENQLLTGNPFLPPRFGGAEIAQEVVLEEQGPVQAPPGAGGAGGGGSAPGQSPPPQDGPASPSKLGLWLASMRHLRAIFLTYIRWEGPTDLLLNLASILAWGDRIEARPLGILLAAPWLAASLAGVVRVVRRRETAPELRFASVFLGVYAILMTNATTTQGDAFDVRLWIASLPAFSLLAAVGIRPWLAGLRPGSLAAVVARSVAWTVIAYGALALLTAKGYRLGTSAQQHTQVFVAVVALAASLSVLVHRLRPGAGRRPDRFARQVAVGMLVPVLAWTVMYCWVVHASLPDYRGHEGGAMFVAGLDPLVDALNDAIVPASPLPIVYDSEGNLFFHPDYGRCDAVPNPCPEPLRRAPWAGNQTAGG